MNKDKLKYSKFLKSIFSYSKLRDYVRTLNDINSILIFDEDTNLSLIHILSGNDSAYRDNALLCLLDENAKSVNRNKLDINQRSGIGNDCWTAVHLGRRFSLLNTYLSINFLNLLSV